MLILSGYNDYILSLFNSRLTIEGSISDSDKFIWIDSKIRGNMLNIINKLKTNHEVKDKYNLSFEDYLLLQQRLRLKV